MPQIPGEIRDHADLLESSEIGVYITMTKEISLTQGKVALVDDEDFDRLNQFKWFAQKINHTVYACRNLPYLHGKRQGYIYMHRIVVDCVPPNIIDHIDGNGLNNQKLNIRVVTKRENALNCTHRITPKSSKYPGVFFRKNRKKWISTIRYKGKDVFIGYFHNEIDAARAYENFLRSVGEPLNYAES
jgi:hypothetical protein